jgi:serine/threonine protein phosphatase PrpC
VPPRGPGTAGEEAGSSIDEVDTTDDAAPNPAPAGAPPSSSPDPAPGHPVPVPQPVDVGTGAPVIGRVLEAVAPRLNPGVVNRPPACVADGVALGRFHVSAASQIGVAHSAQGSVRQDAYGFTLTTQDRLVVAIADGLGSRPNSQVGAAHFCEGVVLATEVTPDASAVDYLRNAARRAAQIAEYGYALEPDAVSFVGAVAVVDGDRCEVARIGDVSAFTIDADGEFAELFAVDGGHVNIVTESLPASGPVEPEVGEVCGVARLVLATDGLANDLRTSGAVRSWLGGIWNGLPTAHAMADALRYRRRGSHDDRTAVVVAIPGPTPTAAS